MVPDKQVCFAKTEDLNTSPKVNWNLKPKTKFKYILNMSRCKKYYSSEQDNQKPTSSKGYQIQPMYGVSCYNSNSNFCL